MMQVDGVNIIEHISFSAFHEGKRLKASIIKHKAMFGACHQVSADAIYATNEIGSPKRPQVLHKTAYPHWIYT